MRQRSVEPARSGEVTAISSEEGFACGSRKDNQRAVCWGFDDFGQASPEPTVFSAISSNESSGALAADSTPTCIRLDNGHARCWGPSNEYGQLTPPTACSTGQAFRPLEARVSFRHSVLSFDSGRRWTL